MVAHNQPDSSRFGTPRRVHSRQVSEGRVICAARPKPSSEALGALDLNYNTFLFGLTSCSGRAVPRARAFVQSQLPTTRQTYFIHSQHSFYSLLRAYYHNCHGISIYFTVSASHTNLNRVSIECLTENKEWSSSLSCCYLGVTR